MRAVELLLVFDHIVRTRVEQNLRERVGIWARGRKGSADFLLPDALVLVLVRLDDVVHDRIGILLWTVDVRDTRLAFELLSPPTRSFHIVILVVTAAALRDFARLKMRYLINAPNVVMPMMPPMLMTTLAIMLMAFPTPLSAL